MKRVMAAILSLSVLMGAPSSAFASSYIMHTVKSGDNLYSISQEHNVSYAQVANLNGKDELYAGNLVKVRPISGNKDIRIYLNDQVITADTLPYIENGRTFVPIRFIAEAIGIEQINWNDHNEEAILMKNGVTISLPIRQSYAMIDHKTITLDAPINIYNGRTFVPLRFVAEAFNVDVEWQESTASVKLYTKGYKPVKTETVMKASISYSQEDLYWLSRLVHAEAEAEPFEGKLAVANCIINRKKSKDFPNTIKEVIFDRNWGVQYTPTANGTIYNTPSEESVKAARMALEGNNNIGESLYFLNPKKSTNNWIVKNRTFYRRIQNHDFYL
ncbi:MAG: N-acetylmuramoyl-L-alanine amidase [Epulopiscium sp.]|nr:stalk domain-containing protein [Defluviitalea raffinosedens]MBM7686134.1 N-acetylmuramoyl-L-alanine amidase [Defluviitalea raffinosedens]MBZ4668399.1 copper amine oxidase [Defluviitaleaceae bacterium]MDK2789013.1 N-acetylmuramoyl-L-alanine amidase [Candidatus Epulonipiscium sp.]HHW68563.1 LysM peptidoglycan-binding domain-containing protein [Candidatus Epulonipiscium sp.]